MPKPEKSPALYASDPDLAALDARLARLEGALQRIQDLCPVNLDVQDAAAANAMRLLVARGIARNALVHPTTLH
ncbi:hypothetical protein [Roseivivax sp. CAU 1761]